MSDVTVSVTAPREPLASFCSTSRSAILTFPEADRAVLSAHPRALRMMRLTLTWGAVATAVIAGVVAAAVTGALPGTTPAFPGVSPTLIWAVAAVVMALDALFLVGLRTFVLKGLGPPRTVFDRRRGVCEQYARGASFPACAPLPLGRVAALQIIRARADFPAWELNMVLSDPPGARGHLMAHGDERALRADAQALAEFLKTPVLDHTSQDA